MAMTCGARGLQGYRYAGTEALGRGPSGSTVCRACVVDDANTQRHTQTRKPVSLVLLMLSAYGAFGIVPTAVCLPRHLRLR